MAVAGSRKVGPVNQVNHNWWMAVVSSTGRPKYVRKRCVIERFVAFLCRFAFFGFSVGMGAFVIWMS